MATATATFSLTATQGPSAIFANKELKFLVTDPQAQFVPAADGTSAGVALTAKIDDQDTMLISKTANTITITNNALAAELGTGGYIFLDDDLIGEATAVGGEGATVASDDTAFYATVAGNDITFTTDIDLSNAGATFTVANNILVADTTNNTVTQLSNLRGSDNSYVVDSGVADGTAQALKLVSPGTTTTLATVQAWVDFTENDLIDTLDYVSPARTITFVSDGDLTGQFALTAPTEGATSLAGTFTTTPLLNGDQTNDAALFGAVFTRQDSAAQAFVVINTTAQDATTGKWSASVNTAAATVLTGWVSSTAAPAAIAGNIDWGFTAPTVRAGVDIESITVTAAKFATVVTAAPHNLRTGDKITITVQPEETDVVAASETSAVITVTDTDTFTYALTETAAVAAGTQVHADDNFETDTGYALVVTSENVFAGSYSGQLAVDDDTNGEFTKVGTASVSSLIPALAADVSYSTVASSVLQGSTGVITTDTTTDALVAAGTLTATVTATVLDADGTALAAGRSVAYSFDSGVNAATIKVNGMLSSASIPALTTDANGQVTFTVTDTTGTAGKKVTITATAEGINGATSKFSVEWATPALAMYDLSNASSVALGATATRSVAAGTVQTLQILVADQFFNGAAAADYRLAVSGNGVAGGFVSLVDGRANVTVTDSGVSTSFTSTITLQKNTAGVFANTSTSTVLTTNTTTKGALTMAVDGSALYGTATDLSDAVAKVALVERDTRVAFVARPGYVNTVVVTGKAASTGTGVALGSSVVTLSGPSNILFSSGAVDSRGSITVVSDANGQFAVTLYSTTAQKDTVITATANGVSSTTKVTFTGIGVGEGTSLVVTMPAAVKPASTFQVKAKLADTFGNGVVAAAGRVKVTYTGAGIVFGTLPTSTDANGELMFSVLLGSNDTGSVNVTVSYDQNGDTDFVDAKDLTTTSTTEITASGVVASETKVNVGSFKGYVALYAKGYKGQKMTAIVAGKWIKVDSLASDFERVVRYTGAGYSITTKIYIDGVQIGDAFTTMTK
jgi:hypothetical protein